MYGCVMPCDACVTAQIRAEFKIQDVTEFQSHLRLLLTLNTEPLTLLAVLAVLAVGLTQRV